jgi:EAL domain-containing protein (putative c-di-GMP-specific phosphodiesterase class I)
MNYQPKVDLATGAMIGAEALIRWHHPRRGLVSPAQFIPVAEETALILPIGRWVLHEVCRQQRAWEDAGLRAIPIAINVSPAELRTKDFVAGVRETLVQTGLNPHCLELELTETCLLQESTSTSAILRDLKELGVRLTLDDFGTGYSSLSFLQKFPIDTLKIDQSFIRDLTTDPSDASIVNAVIGMGDSLHMTVVAEGIETREQLAFLRESHCPEGQGDFFSRPVAAGEFSTLLEPRAVEAARCLR